LDLLSPESWILMPISLQVRSWGSPTIRLLFRSWPAWHAGCAEVADNSQAGSLQIEDAVTDRDFGAIKSWTASQIPRLVRGGGSRVFVFLMVALLVGLFTVPVVHATVPKLQLQNVGDRRVAAALESGYNLPELMGAVSAAGKVPAREWPARIETERRRLAEIVKSFGYLDAEVRLQGEGKGSGASDKIGNWDPDEDWEPGQLQLSPVLGALYRIGIIELDGIVGNGLNPKIEADLVSVLRLFAGYVASADVLSHIENQILWRVRSGSLPLARVVSTSITPDRETFTATFRITIDVGKSVRFGKVSISGLRRSDPQSLMRYVPFSPGDPYDRSQLAALRKRLEALKLFRSVRVASADAPDASGFLPIEVMLRERAPDPEQLASSGFTGLTITAATLLLLAMRQLASAARSSRRVIRLLNLLAVGLIAISAALAVFRVLSFLESG
jgi:hypothetical protein